MIVQVKQLRTDFNAEILLPCQTSDAAQQPTSGSTAVKNDRFNVHVGT
jgi:hypothetical protein